MKRILSLAFCFVLASFAMASCSGDSEPFAQKEYTADPAQVAEIVIDVRDRRIDVAVSEDNQIHILYSENNKETYDISLSSQAVLTMTARTAKSGRTLSAESPLMKTGSYLCKSRMHF